MHWTISYLTRNSPLLIIKGKDTVLNRNGKVDLKALAASHMSEDDPAEDLRQEGIGDAQAGEDGAVREKRKTLGDT
jgi:uncharacterized membrane protein YcaP (DUF421 family)